VLDTYLWLTRVRPLQHPAVRDKTKWIEAKLPCRRPADYSRTGEEASSRQQGAVCDTLLRVQTLACGIGPLTQEGERLDHPNGLAGIRRLFSWWFEFQAQLSAQVPAVRGRRDTRARPPELEPPDRPPDRPPEQGLRTQTRPGGADLQTDLQTGPPSTPSEGPPSVPSPP
jgi:hypothetical protein